MPGDTVTISGGTSAVTAVAKIESTQVNQATVNAAGSGGTTGACTVSGTSGTTPFTASGTVTGGALNAGILTMVSNGHYPQTNPASLVSEPVTGCGLVGATVTIVIGPDYVGIANNGSYSVTPANPVSTGAGSISGATGVTLTVKWLSTGMYRYGTDDSGAFTTAINQILTDAANSGGTQSTAKRNTILYVPTGNYLIEGSGLPVFYHAGGGVIGDGHQQTYLLIGANYTGTQLIGFSENWNGYPSVAPYNLGNPRPLNGPSMNISAAFGPQLRGLSIVGDRTSNNIVDAVSFLDRNEHVYTEDIDTNYVTGRCLYVGNILNTSAGLLQESKIHDWTCQDGGSNLAAFSSTASSVSATTLTIGTVTSGTVAVGNYIAGTGIAPQTQITANLAGSGNGSTWTVSPTTSATGSISIAGTQIIPAMEFTANGSGVTNTNDIGFLNIYAPFGQGLVLHAAAGSKGINGIRIQHLRLEGLENNSALQLGDLLQIGDQTSAFTGAVYSLSIENMFLLNPYKNFAGIKTQCFAAANQIYSILVDTVQYSGGVGLGRGVDLECGRIMSFGLLQNFATYDYDFYIGPSTKMGSAVSMNIGCQPNSPTLTWFIDGGYNNSINRETCNQVIPSLTNGVSSTPVLQGNGYTVDNAGNFTVNSLTTSGALSGSPITPSNNQVYSPTTNSLNLGNATDGTSAQVLDCAGACANHITLKGNVTTSGTTVSSAGDTSGAGLNVTVKAPNATASGNGGLLTLAGGNGNTTGAAGSVTITGGNGGATSGAGGAITITPGTTAAGGQAKIILAGGAVYTGTTFTVGTSSGCTNGASSAATGGWGAGTFSTASAGAGCAWIVTLNGAAGATSANGWDCGGEDRTQKLPIITSASNTTTVTLYLAGTAVANDVIGFHCTPGY